MRSDQRCSRGLSNTKCNHVGGDFSALNGGTLSFTTGKHRFEITYNPTCTQNITKVSKVRRNIITRKHTSQLSSFSPSSKTSKFKPRYFYVRARRQCIFSYADMVIISHASYTADTPPTRTAAVAAISVSRRPVGLGSERCARFHVGRAMAQTTASAMGMKRCHGIPSAVPWDRPRYLQIP